MMKIFGITSEKLKQGDLFNIGRAGFGENKEQVLGKVPEKIRKNPNGFKLLEIDVSPDFIIRKPGSIMLKKNSNAIIANVISI